MEFLFFIKFDGKNIFHAGDLNNWHWNEESTEEEISEAENQYRQEIRLLRQETKCFDIAMFPIDPRLGKDYTKGAEEFLDCFDVKLFIPMHFGTVFEKANAFRNFAEKKGCEIFQHRRNRILYQSLKIYLTIFLQRFSTETYLL